MKLSPSCSVKNTANHSRSVNRFQFVLSPTDEELKYKPRIKRVDSPTPSELVDYPLRSSSAKYPHMMLLPFRVNEGEAGSKRRGQHRRSDSPYIHASLTSPSPSSTLRTYSSPLQTIEDKDEIDIETSTRPHHRRSDSPYVHNSLPGERQLRVFVPVLSTLPEQRTYL